jgi:hypothetical protein
MGAHYGAGYKDRKTAGDEVVTSCRDSKDEERGEQKALLNCRLPVSSVSPLVRTVHVRL